MAPDPIVAVASQSSQSGERHYTALFREARSTKTIPFVPRVQNTHGLSVPDSGWASRPTVRRAWPGIIILAAFAMNRFRKKDFPFFYVYGVLLVLAIIAWNYVKIAARGLF